jgi:glycosyltransferase involved in cell wall biosynthesis
MRVDAPTIALVEVGRKVIAEELPDCLHFHTFGLAEAALATLAHATGIPFIFTYHSPAWSCRRETMLLFGGEPCDGEVRAWRCSACQAAQRLGESQVAGHLATAASLSAGWLILPLGRNSLRRRTAFYYDTLRYRRALRSFLRKCKRVVACCDWAIPALSKNGARSESLIHCPQGVSDTVVAAISASMAEPIVASRDHFVIGYVGRVVAEKGVHILAEAFSRMSATEALLRIVGWAADCSEDPYHRRLKEMADCDARIELVPKMPFEKTIQEYRGFSLLAIPSVWLETGPLTLLEALALGIPVYGSNRLGQLDLLKENGSIVEPNTPTGWCAAIADAHAKWKDGNLSTIQNALPLRTMGDVAEETSAIYREVLRHNAAPASSYAS